MLANLFLFLTVSVIAVKLLDFYMGDEQKVWISDRTMRMWNWLDQAKRVPLLKMVRTPRSKWILFAIATIPAILPYVAAIPGYSATIWNAVRLREHLKNDPLYPEYYIKPAMFLIALLMIVWLGKWVISMILQGKTALRLFLRLSFVLVLLLLVSEAFFDILLKVDADHLRDILGIWTADIILYAIILPTFVVFGLASFWTASASLVAAIYVGSFLLYFGELTVRRIAEYPKGPLLAVGTLLGLAGAAIKVLEGG